MSTGRSEPLFVAVDSSTTACKVLVFDKNGACRAEGRAGHRLDSPEPDAYEQDAEEWWTALASACRSALHALGEADVKRLTALAITHQRETVVVTDDSGKPIHPALVWMDARAQAQVGACVAARGADTLHRLSGKPACVTPSLYKLRYLFEDKAPELRTRLGCVFDVHGFLAERLTGERVTSLASADPLGLVDMAARAWSDPLLELVPLERENLPRLLPPGQILGRVSPKAALQCGLPPGLPVVAGAGDGQCAGLGAGVIRPGSAYLNLGTAVVSGVLSEEYVVDSAFRTLYAATPGAYFLETDLKGGTFTLDWLAERLLDVRSADKDATLARLEAEAGAMDPGAEGLLLVPYWCGVMNPYWDDAASGIALGFQGTHRAAHLYRAILEGIAFEQRLHTSGVEAATHTKVAELIVMGGGSRSDLWCQILADVIEKPVVRSGTPEATALGAAVLAAVATQTWPDFETAVAAMTRTGERFVPSHASRQYERIFEEAYRPIYPALRTVLGKLDALRRQSMSKRSE